MMTRQHFGRIWVILSAVFFSFTGTGAEGISAAPSYVSGYEPLFGDQEMISPLRQTNPTVLSAKADRLIDTTIIDFEKRQITFARFDRTSRIILWQYHFTEFDDYFKALQRHTLWSLWTTSRWQKVVVPPKEKSPFELVVDVNYPRWARRLIGKEGPKLSIKGFQQITLGFKGTNVELASKKDIESSSATGFYLDHDNMFTITGSVGRLLNLEIRTGKNKKGDDFSLKDELKKFKIDYRAEPDSADQLEDEIIQEFTIGYTNFQMPGQGLAGYSGSHEGLVGFKIRTQWGPLSLTNIFSRENAETQKRVLNTTGTEGNVHIKDADYVRNTFFFLDSTYLRYHLNQTTLPEPPEVLDLRVYKLEGLESATDNPNDFVWAFYNGRSEATRFRILKEKTDYFLEKKQGWIRFDANRPSESDMIAIILTTTDPRINKGNADTTTLQNGKKAVRDVWVLKNIYKTYDNYKDSTYFLMWRNVYDLPSQAKPEDIKISVVRNVQGASPVTRNSANKLFSEILGITDANEKVNADQGSIFDFDHSYLFLPQFNGTLPFLNPDLGQLPDNGGNNINPTIYYDSTSYITSYFDIVTFGRQRQTVFDQFFGIIRGSETVRTKGGRQLQRDVDYVIDYEFGRLELISDGAKAETELEVEYQTESLFQFDSKTFLGAYAKLDLPDIGRNSYIASTIMSQFTSTREKIPMLGSEPATRLLFDANMHLDFQPQWMTDAINFLPFLKSGAASAALFDFEIAYSKAIPAKESGGEAYIDNFKSSERLTTLPFTPDGWRIASPSSEWITSESMFMLHPPAWKSYWYSPVSGDNRTKKEELIDISSTDINEDEDEYISTLKLVCQPVPPALRSQVSPSGPIAVQPWTGIMTTLSTIQRDLTRDKSFEFWVKNRPKTGVLYIDFGVVSEDLATDGGLPNRSNNREEKNNSLKTGEVPDSLNTGLDLQFDANERYFYPNLVQNRWDTVVYHDSRIPTSDEAYEDPARDNNATYTYEQRENRSKVNGLEKDKYITSEDISGDGFNTKESYFRVKIDFSDPDVYKILDSAKTQTAFKRDSGWLYFRIPLNIPNDSIHFEKIVNKPAWNNVQFVRILWSGFATDNEKLNYNTIEFYDMKFTGNQWQDVTNKDAGSGQAKIVPSILQTDRDKPPVFFRPPRKDSLDYEKNVVVDYGLALHYESVKPGQQVFVKREMPETQAVDISAYEQLRMYVNENIAHLYVNGKQDLLELDPKSGELVSVNVTRQDFIWFVFRFGNNDSSYFEYRTKFCRSTGDNVFYNRRIREYFWRNDDGMVVDLKQMSSLKEAYLLLHGNRPTSIDTALTFADNSQMRIFSKNGLLPILSHIQYMAYGVTRDSALSAHGIAEGDIWVNGLRTHGITATSGWAMRTSVKTHWADFLDIDANASYDYADFRQMSDNVMKRKDSKLSAGLSSQMSLSKFLPEQLGVTIPIGAAVSAAVSRPPIASGSGIPLKHIDGRYDRLEHMTADFVELMTGNHLTKDKKTAAQHFEENSVRKEWFTSYSKTTTSTNPLVAFTADRITARYSYAKDSTTKKEGIIAAAEKPFIGKKDIGEDHITVTTKRTHTSSLSYDLTPRNPPTWTSWVPLGKSKSTVIPTSVRNYEFKLVPSRFNIDLVSGTYTKRYDYRSLEDKDADTTVEHVYQELGIVHGTHVTYSPIAPV
ncbi:MAG: hypothetical protein JW795_16010, partial [Chitinivibrionales bacterium]|nr:hypothetical protein [Chitinivibrionales bacterium]